MDRTLRNLLIEGIKAHKSGKLDLAQELYREVLSAAPKDPDTNHNLGVLLASRSMLEEALPYLRCALEARPNIKQFWMSFIEYSYFAGEIEQAKQTLINGKRRGLSGDDVDELESMIFKPHSPFITPDQSAKDVFSRLLSSFNQKQFNTVIEQGHNYLKRFPLDHNVINLLGAAFASLSQYETAFNKFQKSIILRPDFADSYSNLGSIFSGNEKQENAFRFFSRATIIWPKNPQAILDLGKCQRGLGDKLSAIYFFKKAIELKPDFAVAFNMLGVGLSEVFDKLEAQKAFVRSIILAPQKGEVYNNYANLHSEMNNHTISLKLFKKSTLIVRNYAPAYNNAGNSLSKLKDYEKAIFQFESALNINPVFPEARQNLGSTLNTLFRYEEAGNELKKAILIKPGFDIAINNLGISFEKVGEIFGALNCFQRALTYNFSNTHAIDNGSILLAQLPESQKGTFSILLEHIEKGYGRTSLRFLCSRLLTSFLSGDFDLSLKIHRQLSDHLTPTNLAKLDAYNQRFCLAYTTMIGHLISNGKSTTLHSSKRNIFHIGESHCLSYAHQRLKRNNETFRIVPMWIAGAKAFHLGSDKSTGYKTLFNLHAAHLPFNSTVFLSFGEIDCRAEEGILDHVSRHGGDVKSVARDTAHKYISYVSSILRKRDCEVFVFDVPAPIEQEGPRPHEHLSKRLEVILEFNKGLKEASNKYKCGLIETYKHTASKSGISNKLHHIDKYHLGPTFVRLIEAQLTRPLNG